MLFECNTKYNKAKSEMGGIIQWDLPLKNVKSRTWQLARVYIYTLPFANLDMILGNANICKGFRWFCEGVSYFDRNGK